MRLLLVNKQSCLISASFIWCCSSKQALPCSLSCYKWRSCQFHYSAVCMGWLMLLMRLKAIFTKCFYNRKCSDWLWLTRFWACRLHIGQVWPRPLSFDWYHSLFLLSAHFSMKISLWEKGWNIAWCDSNSWDVKLDLSLRRIFFQNVFFHNIYSVTGMKKVCMAFQNL